MTDPERSEGTDHENGHDHEAVDADEVRVWLVERTFSDDEQNIVILLYATPDGSRLLRKERALTSFTGSARETTASVLAAPENLEAITAPDEREQYRAEVERVRERYGPDEAI